MTQVEEIIAKAIMENDVCGYTLNENERVFCDDVRLGTEQDAYQKPLRQERCGCREAANAIREALSAAGFAIVPVEPTRDMNHAATRDNDAHYIIGDPYIVWQAMIEASPGYTERRALKGKG